MNLLSTAETANILGVSGATVRNWSRAGYLQPAGQHPLAFVEDDVQALKERIRTNRFNRLRKRANKSASDKYENPKIPDPVVNSDLTAVIKHIIDSREDPAKALYITALHFLEAEGEAHLPRVPNMRFDRIAWKRNAVETVMRDWFERLSMPIQPAPAGVLDAFLSRKDCEDRLGLLYQGLSSVGKKSRAGAYFTPGKIIDDSLADFGDAPESFLDPCCGTGRYLIRAASRWHIAPHNLHGFDTDPVAVDIARLNVLLAYRDLDFLPRIRCLDSLRDLANGDESCDTNHLLDSIDAIATNPPWGGCKNLPRHKNLISLIKSGESFSLFLEKALRLVRPGGKLSFILPESVLKIKAHADLRRLLLETTHIKKISILGRIFSDVFTPIIRLDLVKQAPADHCQVAVEYQGKVHLAAQRRFAANANHSFDVAVTPRDMELIRKIESVPHVTLKGNADWALGIVTGDNQRCVLDAPRENTEPILRGRDVFKFAPREPRCHIEFKPERFQQVAQERYYRAPEKLIYRFVSDRLVFAYDNKGILTLNSANILIPRLPGISIRIALAFLNSRVFQYLFVKRFRTRKVLRSDLETMPFPVPTPGEAKMIEEQVDLCMGGEYKPAEELDNLIFKMFGLDDADVMALETNLEAEAEQSKVF